MSDRTDDTRLHGRWRLLRTDDARVDTGEDVEMEFLPDGRLTYTIRERGRNQIMLLTYYVDGQCLVSDQPSAPGEMRTKYGIEADGILILDFAGSRSWFERLPA